MFNKKEFIRELTDELNYESENMDNGCLSVAFMISAVDQGIEKMTDFIDEIGDRNICFNGFELDSDGYSIGKMRILVEKENPESSYMVDQYENYVYYIDFSYDGRMWGYCECVPDMPDYNDDKRCCGHGCDWDAPSFSITKSVEYGDHSFQGYESDYWNFETKFKKDEENLNLEVEKRLKEENAKRIKSEIARLQEQLKNVSE